MTKLVGVLNVTPDSFSDGGKFLGPTKAIAQARKLFNDGASIVDIGAESTKPGATALTHTQEWERLKPTLAELLTHYPDKISLDTYHPETVHKSFEIGPVIVNDITGMNNPEMVKAVILHEARCIISHLPGTDIQHAHQDNPVTTLDEVTHDLLIRERQLVSRGLNPQNIILDPGIGFGKTPDLNRQLLAFAQFVPGKSVMIGYSRKRFLGENRMDLAPNLEAGKIAIESGADYLRVHDVKGHASLIV